MKCLFEVSQQLFTQGHKRHPTSIDKFLYALSTSILYKVSQHLFVAQTMQRSQNLRMTSPIQHSEWHVFSRCRNTCSHNATNDARQVYIAFRVTDINFIQSVATLVRRTNDAALAKSSHDISYTALQIKCLFEVSQQLFTQCHRRHPINTDKLRPALPTSIWYEVPQHLWAAQTMQRSQNLRMTSSIQHFK